MEISLEKYYRLLDLIVKLAKENEELKEAVSCPPHWMHWISVKDRLPEDEGLVLAFGVGGIVIAEHYRFGQWVIFMLDKDGRYMSPYPTTIYYWMPLPEPPEEAKDGTE